MSKLNATFPIVLIMLILVRFFDLIVVPAFRPVYYILTIVLFVITIKEVASWRSLCSYEKALVIFAGGALVSCIYSNIFNHQKLTSLIIVTYPYFCILSYFMFKKLNIDLNTTRRVILWFSIIMCICYLIQYAVYPINIFGSSLSETDINDEADMFRMRFVCTICSYMLIFMGINRYLTEKNMLCLFLSVLGGVPVLIMGFRSLIALSIFSVLLLAFFVKPVFSQYIKYGILIYISSIVLLQVPIVQDKLEEMMERQESDQTFDNKDYVRYISLYYYNDYYTDNLPMRFFGSGIPLVSAEKCEQPSNEYQSYVFRGYNFKLYWNDLGIIGLGFMLGIPALLSLIYLCYYMIRNCREPEDQYIRFTILTIFLGSIFTSQELYRTGNFVVMGLLMYYISIKNKKSNLIN